VAEIRRFHAVLNRPNIMFKVPATTEGLPAIEALIADGINVNVTLIFGLQQYRAVANAYISGLEKLVAAGGDASKVSSVASFFVSRVDTAVDKALDELGVADLKGKIAIANAKVAFAVAGDLYATERWQKLAARGARVQRLLWASTSTKNPAYADTLWTTAAFTPPFKRTFRRQRHSYNV